MTPAPIHTVPAVQVRSQKTHLDRQLQRSKLLKKLNEAIAAEQYERAAEIRDSLQGLGGSVLGGED